jgi:transcription antitermination factor NusG
MWYVARTRHNQEKFVKTKLEQIGVEHFVPFRKEFRRRRDRTVELVVPVIPNLVFIHTDYSTSLTIANNYGVRLSYIREMGGSGHLVVPQKQMDDFRLICESNVDYTLSYNFTKGDRVAVIDGCLAGLEGELLHTGRHGGRVVVKLDSIASFEVTISTGNLRKIK